MHRELPAALAISAALAAQPALAQEAPAPTWQVEATAGVVSDYRYRGLSLSDGKPAAQAGATVTHASGVYGDAYLSTIEEYGVGADGDGAKVEATLTMGWAGSVSGLDVDAAVAAYRYPDGSSVSYYEFPVQIARTRGAFTWTLGAAWAPRGQKALGDRSNRYAWAGVDLAPERSPVHAHASVGHEEGAYAPGGKRDWAVGLSAPLGPLEARLDYVDSDAGAAKLVASLFAAF